MHQGIGGGNCRRRRLHHLAGSGGEGLAIELWGGCPRSVIEDDDVDHWISVDGGELSLQRR